MGGKVKKSPKNNMSFYFFHIRGVGVSDPNMYRSLFFLTLPLTLNLGLNGLIRFSFV